MISPYTRIKDNVVSNNSDYGIATVGTTFIHIENNTVHNNVWGIGLHDTTYSNVTNNTVHANTEYGIWLATAGNHNNVSDNTVRNNTRQLQVEGSQNIIFNNEFTAYDSQSVVFDDVVNNQYYIPKNCSDVNILGGLCSGGNAWSDYLSADGSSPPDGIGEIAYFVFPADSVDYYPLTLFTGSAGESGGNDVPPLENITEEEPPEAPVTPAVGGGAAAIANSIVEATKGDITSIPYACPPTFRNVFGSWASFLDVAACEMTGILSLYLKQIGGFVNVSLLLTMLLIYIGNQTRRKTTTTFKALVVITIAVMVVGAQFLFFSLTVLLLKIAEVT